MKIPLELPVEKLTAIRDPREQHGFELAPPFGAMIEQTLNCGDYSILGLEHIVRVEKKAEDLLSCCGVVRPMLMSQMDRLRGFPSRCLVLEWTWPQIRAGGWRSKISPASVLGTLIGIAESGIPVFACGSHQEAADFTAKFLYTAARRRWREARQLVADVEGAE